jgi:DNA-binding SARP family transcriptional activator
MNGLALSLLGPFAASLNGRPIHKFRTNRVQALLAFVATEGALGNGRHRREALMELLWPGLPRKSAQMNLRQTIYTLRKTIPEIPAIESGRSIPFLNSDRLTLEINLDYPLELDVAQFTHLLNSAPEGWGVAVEHYRGDFLADFYLPDSSAFEEWAGQRRAAFRG